MQRGFHACQAFLYPAAVLSARSTGVGRGNSMAAEWISYATLGERLGISPEAARQKAIRAKWSRKPANDGKTLVLVDFDDLRPVPVRRTKEQASDTPPAQASDTRIPDATVAAVEVLSRHIARLEAELATVKGERDQAQAVAAQVEGLKATLAAVEGERDRWHQAATAPRGLARLFRRG